MALGSDEVRYTRDDGVAVVTLDRPAQLNALSLTVMDELIEILDAVQRDRSVKVLLLTGAGDKAFSAGFDLDGLDMPVRTDEVVASTERNFDILMRLWNLRVPVVTAVNGYAIAAGSNLALIADVVIAAENAKFGEPEVRHYALSPLLLLPWLANNRKRANYLYFTGDTIDAATALDLGLVMEVVPHEELMDRALRVARRIAMAPGFAVEMTKESLRRTGEVMGFTQALQQHRLLDTIVLNAHGIPERDRFFDLMAQGDMRAFLAERDGPFKNQA